jgi:uncharacterized membrane protein YcaP (DUF421 family)
MANLIGSADHVAWVALKALLLYLTAVLGFRVGERRTLSEISPFDFIAAVAVGAVVGRVPNATDASYAAGAATLIVILAAHWCVTRLRQFPSIAHILEHPPRVLIAHGQVLEPELRRCGLTLRDLYSLLRQRGIEDLAEVRYLIFEQRGQISIVRSSARVSGDPRLLGGAADPAAP